jgi:hypothetical protein
MLSDQKSRMPQVRHPWQPPGADSLRLHGRLKDYGRSRYQMDLHMVGSLFPKRVVQLIDVYYCGRVQPVRTERCFRTSLRQISSPLLNYLGIRFKISKAIRRLSADTMRLPVVFLQILKIAFIQKSP